MTISKIESPNKIKNQTSYFTKHKPDFSSLRGKQWGQYE